ncbi:MAG: hypothetical protein PVG13_08120, partial [Thiohalophilus sp.]
MATPDSRRGLCGLSVKPVSPRPHTLALTPGEPAGIGPDLVIQLAQQTRPVPLVAIADPELLEQRAQKLGL